MTGHHASNARLAALRTLSQVLDHGQSLGDASRAARGLEPRDEAFARHLAYGVMRWYGALDWLSGQLLESPLRARDADVHRLVMVGLYQLWQEDSPAHAAVHATAEAARQLKKKWAVGLVNALLRRFQRERETLLAAMGDTDHQYAHPGWLLKQLREDWPDDWQGVVKANNQQAPLWIRVNRRKTDRDAMAVQLREAGFEAYPNEFAPEALRVEPAVPVQRLPGFAEGLVSVQDPAAQLAPYLLAAGAWDRVLDACAAPGGKTCHVLETAPDVNLTSLDRQDDRVGLIRENLRRLGLNAKLLTADAVDVESWWDGQAFQRILLDAPCTATGVIRRHPEIKCLRTPEQVDGAVRLQARLLDRLWPLLDAGGILVYATCSVLKCENSKQIHDFLQRHTIARCIGPVDGPGIGAECGRQILPEQDGMDGFYYAVLQKPA